MHDSLSVRLSSIRHAYEPSSSSCRIWSRLQGSDHVPHPSTSPAVSFRLCCLNFHLHLLNHLFLLNSSDYLCRFQHSSPSSVHSYSPIYRGFYEFGHEKCTYLEIIGTFLILFKLVRLFNLGCTRLDVYFCRR